MGMKDKAIDECNQSMADNLEGLLANILIVLESEDNTGCSEDLTVVSKEAIENLRADYERIMGV